MRKVYFVIIGLFIFVSFSYGAEIKVTALPEDTAPTGDDLVMTVDSPGTTPANKKVTVNNLFKNRTITGNDYPAYASSGTTDQGTKNINIDGAAYSDYLYSPLAGTAGVYTPVITSAPGSGNVRYITLTIGGGTNGVGTITWTNVDTIGGTMATSVTAGKFSHYACRIPASGNAKCAVVGENKDY